MLSLLDNDQYASSLKVWLESGRAQELMRFLDEFSKERTRDIQQVCGTFYQVFGDFDKLSSLEKDAEKAKEELEKLALTCAEAGKTIRKNSQIVTQRFSLLHNKDVANQAIDTCLALLDDVETLQRMVDDKDKLSEALCMLKKIQGTYIIPLSGRVDFVRHVASQLPKVEAALIRQANSQVTAWLTLAWEACQVVGCNELAAATKILTRQSEIEMATRKHLLSVASRSKTSSTKKRAVVEQKSAPSSPDSNQFSLKNLAPTFEEFQLFTSVTGPSRRKVDDVNARVEKRKVMKDLTAGFNSLAEAVFVSQQLGIMNAVSEDYYETKNLQIPKLFQNSSLNNSRSSLPAMPASPTSSSSSSSQPGITDRESRQRFQTTLETVAGFFAIETDVAQSFEELLSKDQLQDLWRAAVVKCKQIFMNEFAVANSRSDFLDVLKTVLEFNTSCAQYHFDSHPLLECVSNSASVRYCEIEYQGLISTLGAASSKLGWEPFEIKYSEDFQTLVLDNGLPHNGVAVPQLMSFSPIVPFFFSKLKDSIDNLFALSQYFGDIERQIAHHADVCFQYIIRILSTKPNESTEVVGSSASRQKVAIQKLADLTALGNASDFFQDYVQQRCVFGHKPSLEASRSVYDGALNVVVRMCKDYLSTALDAAMDHYSAEWNAVISGTGRPAGSEIGAELKRYITDTEQLLRRLRKDHMKEIRSLYGRIPQCILSIVSKGKKIKWSLIDSFAKDVEAIVKLTRPIDDNPTANQLQQIVNLLGMVLRPDESKVVAFSSSENCPPSYRSHSSIIGLMERIKSDSNSPSDFNSRTKSCIKALSRK